LVRILCVLKNEKKNTLNGRSIRGTRQGKRKKKPRGKRNDPRGQASKKEAPSGNCGGKVVKAVTKGFPGTEKRRTWKLKGGSENKQKGGRTKRTRKKRVERCGNQNPHFQARKKGDGKIQRGGRKGPKNKSGLGEP